MNCHGSLRKRQVSERLISLLGKWVPTSNPLVTQCSSQNLLLHAQQVELGCWDNLGSSKTQKLGSAPCTRLLILGQALPTVQPDRGCVLRACCYSAMLAWCLFAYTDSPGQVQQVSANLLEQPRSDQHWQPGSLDVGGKLHMDHLSHTENNIYVCRSVYIWEWSLCAVLGAPSYSIDMWTGGWHSLFLALVGQLIYLLCLAGFSISNLQFSGRARIQEAETSTGAKRSKADYQDEHGRFWFKSNLPDTGTVFQTSVFYKRILSFAILGFDGK